MQLVACSGFDPESGQHCEGEFKRQGIKMNPDFSPVKVVKGKDGKLTMTAKNNDDKEITVEGLDHILMATGRKPSTAGLFPEDVMPYRSACPAHCITDLSPHPNNKPTGTFYYCRAGPHSGGSTPKALHCRAVS